MASFAPRPARMRWIAAVPPLLWALFTSGVPSTAAAKAPASMTANDANSALFAEIFSDIQSYYIEPMSLSGLAQAGLDALGGSADVFAVALDDKTVYFHHRGEVLGQAARPADDDAFGWGAVIAVGIDQAKAVTPGLGQAGDDDVDETVVDGMLKKFDRFSRYSSPESAQAQRDNRDGFGGIGIGIDQTDPLPRVTDVFAGGPAADAGIAIDDHLVAIDGKLLNGLGRDAVVDMLRGPIASTVDVAVRRQGAAIPLTFHLTRALIVPPTVTREAAGRGILALRISEFNAETSSSLDAALQEAKRHTPEPLRGVIIDLRGNPGGLLAKGGGVDSASLFLDRGDIVSTRGRNPGSMQHFVADNHDVTGGLPLVILVNGGSASAAEVMAAALQDQGRAVVIGSASYGKGTVQEVNDLRNGAELTLTWARLFPPDGYLLHTHGVIPQFCTSRPGESLEAEIDEGVHPRDPLQMLPRARLDDGQWATLRSHCPPTSAENPHDMELARRLLGDPKIYAAALKGPAATIARSAGD